MIIDRKKDATFKFRLSSEDRDLIFKTAEAENVTVSELVRYVVMKEVKKYNNQGFID